MCSHRRMHASVPRGSRRRLHDRPVYDKTVVLVASITGLTLRRGGLAIFGEPLTDHPLIGRPDPLHTPKPLCSWRHRR
jgi:hypothetical protein